MSSLSFLTRHKARFSATTIRSRPVLLRRQISRIATFNQALAALSSSGSLGVSHSTVSARPHAPIFLHGFHGNHMINNHHHRICVNYYQNQQIRTYFYIPVSWSEVKERFQRWVEKTEQRIVKVKLLSRRATVVNDGTGVVSSSASPAHFPSPPPLSLTARSRSYIASTRTRLKRKQQQMKWWVARQRNKALKLAKRSSTSRMIQASSHDRMEAWRSRYQRWKARKSLDYGAWKSRRTEQYQGWKLRRQAQVRGWNDRRDRAWVRTRQILLEEYSRPEWFDRLGRPLTSRDSTGRFVNPWLSQSTNGVHSLETILRWRWQRFQRGLQQLGLVGLFTPAKLLPWLTSSAPLETDSPLSQKPVPPLPAPKEAQLHCTWLGHATCLFQVDQTFTVLVDPIFSVRSSPSQNLPIGVARDIPPACTIAELVDHQQQFKANTTHVINENGPGMNGLNGHSDNHNTAAIDVCCITHDHYDHLDRNSVLELKDHVQLWVTPLGVGDWLAKKCDIDRRRIVELEWWEQVQLGKKRKVDGSIGGECAQIEVLDQAAMDRQQKLEQSTGDSYDDLTITCCPASHWASRTLWDRNFRLWCSFAFVTPSYKFFLCGDTSYPENFPLFRQIGDALGPFDLAAIPIGAYEPMELNKDSHVTPREAVQIHQDIRSRQSVAIHWGTFQLSEEPMDEPPKDLRQAIDDAETRNSHDAATTIHFDVLGHGETLVVKEAQATAANATPVALVTVLQDDLDGLDTERIAADDESEGVSVRASG